MRARLYGAALLLAAAGAVGAAPEPLSPFTFPAAPVAPAPVPVPGAVPTLTPDALYVVNSKVDASVRGYPAGLVTVTKEAGPLRVRGRFVDGSGKVETRTFPGPHVFVVEATGVGRVDLVLTPFGLKSESEIESRALDVKGGTGPQPPPKPDPDVKPKPVPASAVWAIVVEESSARTAAVALLLNDTAMWARLKARGVSYRIYDKDSPDVRAKKYDLATADVGLPAVLLLDGAGKIVRAAKLPATAAELEALVK